MVFAERLKYLINEAGYRQTEVAEFLDITPPQVSRMVNGQSTPTFKTLLKIVTLFNCSFDFLLSRDNFPIEKRYTSAITEINSALNLLREKKKNDDIEISDELAELTLDLVKKAVVELLKDKDIAKNLNNPGL